MSRKKCMPMVSLILIKLYLGIITTHPEMPYVKLILLVFQSPFLSLLGVFAVFGLFVGWRQDKRRCVFAQEGVDNFFL